MPAMRIADAANLWDLALLIIERRGFSLAIETSVHEGEQWETWVAEKEDVRLEAETPTALLGMTSIWSEAGTSWLHFDCGNINERVVERMREE